MNRDESLELWRKGKYEWNKWALKKLKEKKNIEGDLKRDELGFYLTEGGSEAAKWIDESTVYFSGHVFEDDADFSGFIFPGQVFFNHPHKMKYTPKGLEAPPGAVAEFRGKANFRGAQFHGPTAFDGVKFLFEPEGHMLLVATVAPQTCADFSKAVFYDIVDFYMCEFAFETVFSKAKFLRHAGFRRVEFRGYTWFDGCIFGDQAFRMKLETQNYTHHGSYYNNYYDIEVRFSKSTFHSNVEFGGSVFFSDAYFELTKFVLPARLSGRAMISRTGNILKKEDNSAGEWGKNVTIFCNEACFRQAKIERGLDFGHVAFKKVPDFREANFTEPPDLDDMTIDDGNTPADDETYRKYRALRRIAEEGGNHLKAVEFFAREIRSRRGVLDFPFGPGMGRWWWGWAYDLFSDFGRSFIKPFVAWLMATFVVFPLLYWYLLAPGRVGDVWLLSLQRGLVISGIWDAWTRNKLMERLFDGLGPGFGTVLLMTFQTLVSAGLLFLFFLALRNFLRYRS